MSFIVNSYTGWVKKTDTFDIQMNNKGVSFFLLTLYSFYDNFLITCCKHNQFSLLTVIYVLFKKRAGMFY
jgi:hypothetical protein